MAEDDLGSLDGGLQDPETEAAPPAPSFATEAPQPINQATMMCLRGPCVHLWRLVLRYPSAVKDVMTERSLTCLASPSEEFELNEKLVYYCDRWWPRAPLRDDKGRSVVGLTQKKKRLRRTDAKPVDVLDVPVEERGSLRPKLHEAWEAGLRKLGYDFSWRDFDPTANPDDSPEQRGHSGPGDLGGTLVLRYHDGADDLPPAGSIPEDDPPEAQEEDAR